MASTIRTVCFVAGCSLFLTVSGCSREFDYGATGTIKGRLTLEGKALSPKHAVSFMDMQKGFLAYGKTDADGQYVVDSWNNGRMPIGKYRVLIAPPALENAGASNKTAEEKFDHPDMEVNWKMEFPKKYRGVETSGLEYEVKVGENTIDIDLKNPKNAAGAK